MDGFAKSAKTESGCVLGACRLASCTLIATGRSDYHLLGNLLLSEKDGSKDYFGEPLKIEHGCQTDLLPLDGNFGRLKCLGKPFWNNLKNKWSVDVKTRGTWDINNMQHLLSGHRFQLFLLL